MDRQNQQSFSEKPSELIITTDDHKCGLGNWLHGEDAKKAAQSHPELKVTLEAAVSPHNDLHVSAIEIEKALGNGNTSKASYLFEIRNFNCVSQD